MTQPAGQPDSHAPFPGTAWTLIRQAQGTPESQRRELLGRLAARYWNPLYAYFRSKGQSRDDAQDLVQAFLVHLTTGERIRQVQPNTKFRHWLMACARNFMVDHHRKDKRRPEHGAVSLEAMGVSTARPFEPPAGQTPEEACREGWRRTVLERAFEAVEETCRRQQRTADYEIFQAYYVRAEPGTTWQQLARAYGLESWKQAARRADWVKDQLARAIRSQVREYVDADDEVDDEIRDLLT